MSEITATEQVFIVVGGLNDAPGFKIVSDGHGGFKVVPIPPWNPELLKELGAAMKVLTSAAQIKSAEGSSIVNTAGKLVHGQLQRYLGDTKAGHTAATVVVIGG